MDNLVRTDLAGLMVECPYRHAIAGCAISEIRGAKALRERWERVQALSATEAAHMVMSHQACAACRSATDGARVCA
jgi:cyanophycinase-like exopeptidase